MSIDKIEGGGQSSANLPQYKIWYSVREKIWDTRSGKFRWKGESQVWDWDKCTVGLARSSDDTLKLIVRSSNLKHSGYMGKEVNLRYMMGFDVTDIKEPVKDTYIARNYSNDPQEQIGPKERWVLELNDEHWIWQWADAGNNSEISVIHEIYQKIRNELENQQLNGDNIFDASIDDLSDEIIPVIYQPAVDSLRNFVRDVYIHKNNLTDEGQEVEITLLFENEELRRHSFGGIVNRAYEIFRRLRHGRTLDIETFKLHIPKNGAEMVFTFENIYSNNHGLAEDSIHGDRPQAPRRNVKYYLGNPSHPVVFINTSNHAMAEFDCNHEMWKWEYIPWLKDSPVKLGDMSRKDIEKTFKPLLKFRSH